MQWVQGQSQNKVDNLNNSTREDSSHFINKKKEYRRAKIQELETNFKIKNIMDLYRVINDFQKDYQPGTNIVKNEKGDLVTYSHSILVRWRNHFSQLFNMHGVNEVRHTEIHTVEPLVLSRVSLILSWLLKR